MSYQLACSLSDRIAAIASVTGSFNVNQMNTCHPGHQMPVMEIHGTADPTVPYDGNVVFAPIPSVVKFWVNFNNCETPATITSLPDIDTNDGCTAEHQLFSNGTNGATVEHYKIIGGVHAWPGTAFGGAGTNQDMDASREIWRFFSKYDIHGLINSVAVKEPIAPTSIFIYPNPAESNLTIENNSNGSLHYAITNLIGQQMISGQTQDQKLDIPIESLSPGMYVIRTDNKSFIFAKQ